MASFVRRGAFALLTLLSITASAAPAISPDGFVMTINSVYRPLEEVMRDVTDARALGAGHFLMPVLLCQDDRTSTRIDWCPQAADTYIALGRAVRAQGATVALLPFLMARDGTWRGFFEPTDFDAWAASYAARLDEVARIADAIGVSEFVLGTELNHLYVSTDAKLQKRLTRFWTEQLARFRTRLGVPALIIANWDQWNAIPFWKESDALGLSSYFPLADALDSDTSVDALARRWREHAQKLADLSRQLDRPLYFGELGYPSIATAAKEPWNYAADAPQDLELQARLFEAFGRVWADPAAGFSARLKRFTIWALDREAAPLQSQGYSVLGKPAEAAVREVFRARTR